MEAAVKAVLTEAEVVVAARALAALAVAAHHWAPPVKELAAPRAVVVRVVGPRVVEAEAAAVAVVAVFGDPQVEQPAPGSWALAAWEAVATAAEA